MGRQKKDDNSSPGRSGGLASSNQAQADKGPLFAFKMSLVAPGTLSPRHKSNSDRSATNLFGHASPVQSKTGDLRLQQLLTALASFALILAGETQANASTTGIVKSEPITLGSKLSFHSEVLNRDVTMKLWVPSSFQVSSADHTYPVVFVHGEHGNRFFETLVGLVKLLGSRERMPESIVVSLNSIGDIPDVFTNGMWGAEKLERTGDPDRSVQHLRQEVFPFLEREYRANQYRIIIGVSGSSLFPIYTFTHAPDLFRGHVLVAAADMIGMGYSPGTSFTDSFVASLEKTPARKAKLFVATADQDLQGNEAYRANLDEIRQRLMPHQGIDVRTEIIANTDHYEVFIKAVLSGFDQHFPMSAWSAQYRDLAAQPGHVLANLDRYYQELSVHYGFKILPRANCWNSPNCLRSLMRHMIELERPQEALAVAQRRVQYRPRDAGAYGGLADAHHANNNLSAAVVAQRQALELATNTDASTSARFEQRLVELEALAASTVGQREDDENF